MNLDQITVLQFNAPITATFEENGVQFGRTLVYSIGTYLYKNYTKNNAQTDLIKALYIYGSSVYNYYK